MNLKELLTKNDCSLKSNLKYEIGLRSNKKIFYRKQVLKNIFLDKSLDTVNKMRKIDKDYLNKLYLDELFDSEKEKEAYVNNSMIKIRRFVENMGRYEHWKMTKLKKGCVNIGNEEVTLNVDMVLEDKNEVMLISILDETAKIKNRGQTDKTKSSCSLELYAMYKLGQQLYPGKIITSALLHLEEETKLNYLAVRTQLSDDDIEYFDNLVASLVKMDSYLECEECNKYCEYYSLCSYTHSLEEYKAVEVEESLIKERELPVINFSLEQKNVILFNKGYGVVNAVAGAGKTTVLTKRIERLLTVDACDPEDIVVISFSEKTIDEFNEKLLKNFGIEDFNNIYTFNGFGDKLIKEEYSLFGYSKPPKLIDEITKYEIIREIIDNTEIITELDRINEIWKFPAGMLVKNLNYKMMFPTGGFGTPLIFQISRIFDDIKKMGLSYSSEQFFEDNYDKFAEKVTLDRTLSGSEKSEVLNLYKKFLNKIYSRKTSMYGKYVYMLKDRGLYDYMDQINYLVSSFSNPRLKNKFNYTHIICDEFQDSNDLAMLVLKKLTLSDNFKSLLVVGDINQSIYGFQGATPENLASFDKYFNEEVSVFDISYSYRVPQIVARKSNALMQESTEVNYNVMNAFKKEEGLSSELKNRSELINVIRESIKKDETIGIIARNNEDLNDFIDILVKNDIPYAVKSNLYIMKKPKVVNLNNLYQFLINPSENKLELAKYLMILENDVFESKFKTKEYEAYFEEKYNHYVRLIDTKNPSELLMLFYDMLEPLAKKDYMIETYLNNIKREKPKKIEDVSNYCYKLEIYVPTIKVPENNLETNVILTTGHSSKGREFDTVIIDTSTFTSANEEDRRLFYVAMTRAKKSLYFIKLRRRIMVSRRKNCDKYMNIIDRVK